MTRPRISVRPRRHALDEDDGPSMSALRGAHGKLKEACDSLGKLFGKDTFPFAEAREHCKAAADHAGAIHELLGGGEGEDDELTEAERDKAAEEARDDLGEVPAKSAVTTEPGGPDHRKDFNPINQRAGADAAMGYDVNTLFQIDSDDPRYRYPVTRRPKPKQRTVRPSSRHAHDTLADAGFDVYSLFQRDL